MWYPFFLYFSANFGEVAEWSKAHAWKVCIPSELESRVRIPLSPQDLFTFTKQTLNKY